MFTKHKVHPNYFHTPFALCLFGLLEYNGFVISIGSLNLAAACTVTSRHAPTIGNPHQKGPLGLKLIRAHQLQRQNSS